MTEKKVMFEKLIIGENVQAAHPISNLLLIVSIYNNLIDLNSKTKKRVYAGEIEDTPGLLSGINLMTEATLHLLKKSLEVPKDGQKNVTITKP